MWGFLRLLILNRINLEATLKKRTMPKSLLKNMGEILETCQCGIVGTLNFILFCVLYFSSNILTF